MDRMLNQTDFLLADYLFYLERGSGKCWMLLNPVESDRKPVNSVLAFGEVRPDIYEEYLALCREKEAGGKA
jgi:hypothetical protein